MVDSVKNYGIAGVGTVLELGKQGAKIDASSSSVISFKDFLLTIYKQELDEYYDSIYNMYVVNKTVYYEETQITNY